MYHCLFDLSNNILLNQKLKYKNNITCVNDKSHQKSSPIPTVNHTFLLEYFPLIQLATELRS